MEEMNLQDIKIFSLNFAKLDFHLCWKGGSTKPGIQGQQTSKYFCDLHTHRLKIAGL